MSLEDTANEYRAQLALIEEALEATPDDAGLLSLKQELISAIATSETLVNKGIDQSQVAFTGGNSCGGWKLGERCIAKWDVDDVEYDGVVTEFRTSDEQALISFTGYGNQQWTPIASLKRPTRSAARAVVPTSQAPWKTAGTSSTSGSVVARPPPPTDSKRAVAKKPEILETDSEQVKQKKKRQIKKINREVSANRKSKEQEKKKKGWQKFKSKRKRSSIFELGNEANASVGVVGGGRGVTEKTTGVRKRWKETQGVFNPKNKH